MLVEFKAEIAGILTHTETVDTEEIRREHGISTHWNDLSEFNQKVHLKRWFDDQPLENDCGGIEDARSH